MKMSKVEFDCGKWLQEAEEFALPNWSALPSIPLYMDQVMMFTGEALSLFERDEKQSLLTNSMINNYVKSGVVDHPVQRLCGGAERRFARDGSGRAPGK